MPFAELVPAGSITADQKYGIAAFLGHSVPGTAPLCGAPDTPAVRPKGAKLVESGYVVLSVDRPTHGRLPFHPEVIGGIGPARRRRGGSQVFFPPRAIMFDPPLRSSEHMQAVDPGLSRIPILTNLPVGVISGEVSLQVKVASDIVSFFGGS